MSAHTPALDSPLYTGKTERDAPGSLYAPSLRAPAPSHYRPRLYVAAVIMSLPGWLFGFDTGSIGPVTSMPLFPALSAGLQGFVVALMLITALLASLLAGPVSDKLGRRRTVAIGCAVHAVGSALCVASSGLGLFLAGRAIAGLGEGLFLSQSGVWAVESAPKERRGRLGGLSQLCIILGLCAGYFVCYGSVNINSLWSWRTPYLCQTALAATLCGLILTKLVPESPRWTLLRTDDVAGALRVVDAFAQTPASGETEKAELVLRTAAERADVAHARAAGAGGWLARIGFGGIADCFQKREDRRWKTLTAVVFMAIQQLSGIDAVLFYAPTIFSSAGLSSTNASFLASGITGIIGIVVTFPAQHWMMDRVGRRTMLVGGGIVMSVVMLTIGAIYASGAGETSRAAKWVVVACIYIYVAAFQVTWSLVMKVFISEIQPNSTRASALALGFACNWVANIVIALSTPPFLDRSLSGPYFLYGGCTVVGTVLGLFMPETMGLSMQAIDAAWDAKVAQIARHSRAVRRRTWRRGDDGDAVASPARGEHGVA